MCDSYNNFVQVIKLWVKNMSTSSRWIPLNVKSPLGPDEASFCFATSSFPISWTKCWCVWRTSWKVGWITMFESRHCLVGGAWNHGWGDGHRSWWDYCQSHRRRHVCQPSLSFSRAWPFCIVSMRLFSTSVDPSITCQREQLLSAM